LFLALIKRAIQTFFLPRLELCRLMTSIDLCKRCISALCELIYFLFVIKCLSWLTEMIVQLQAFFRSLGGLVLDHTVANFEGIAVFQPVINGKLLQYFEVLELASCCNCCTLILMHKTTDVVRCWLLMLTGSRQD
jgi:hypothetical protein